MVAELLWPHPDLAYIWVILVWFFFLKLWEDLIRVLIHPCSVGTTINRLDFAPVVISTSSF